MFGLNSPASQIQAQVQTGQICESENLMDFSLTNSVGQKSGNAGTQESSSAAPSADAAVFERQLSETGSSGGRVLTQAPTHQSGVSPSETQPLMPASGDEHTSAPHARGGGPGPSAQPGPSTGVLVGRSNRPVYSDDAPLISGLGVALIKGGAAKRTAENNVSNLLTLDRWLFENNRGSIAARLDNQSLIGDVQEFTRNGGTKKVHTALDHLRTSESAGGIVPIAGLVELNPYPRDAALIKEYKHEAATHSAQNYATSLSRFSDYLRERNKPGIAARLSEKSLDEDVDGYKKMRGRDPKIGSALTHLRKSRAGARVVEEAERHIPTDPSFEDAALIEPARGRDATAQHSASEGAISWPEVLRAEGRDDDVPFAMMDDTAPSSPLEATAQKDASPRETPPIMQGSADECTSASHVEAGGRTLNASVLQPDQSAGVYVGGSTRPLYSDDASLILGLEEAIDGSNGEHLLNLARWLFENNKPSIAARLHEESLTLDVEEFGLSSVATALAHLRAAARPAYVAPPIIRRAVLKPYRDDAALIKSYKTAPAERITQDSVESYATLLTDLGDYLRKNGKPGIAARLSDRSVHELDKDVEGYKSSGGKRKIRTALAHFLKSPAAARAMALDRQSPPVPDPEDAMLMEPRQVGDAAARHGASQAALSRAEVLPAEVHNQNFAWEMIDEAGLSSTPEPTGQVGASPREAQPIVQVRHEYTPSSQEGGTAIPGAPALQPGQSPWAFVGLIGDPLYSRDASLIEQLKPALIKRMFKARTITDNVNALLRLGRWLLKNNKPEIAARLNHESLDEDVKAFDKTPNRSVLTALGHLRASQSEGGGAPIASRADLHPYPDDAAIIKEYKETIDVKDRKTVYKYTTALSSFSDYLRRNNKAGIATRLFNEALDRDVKVYRKERRSHPNIAGALARLRSSPPGTRAKELRGSDFQPSEGSLVNDEYDAAGSRSAKRQRGLDDPQGVTAERRPSENDNPDVRLLRPSTHAAEAGVSLKEARPLMQTSGHEGTAASYDGGGEAMPGASAPQQGQSIGVLADRSDRTLPSEDAPLTSELEGAFIEETATESAPKSRAASRRRSRADLGTSFKVPAEIVPITGRAEGGDAAAQHSASVEAFSWPEELPSGGDSPDLPQGVLSWPEALPGEGEDQMSLEPAARHRQVLDPGEAFFPLNWRHDHQQNAELSNLVPNEDISITNMSPYLEDEALIRGYKAQAAKMGTSNTANSYASFLIDFSHYLRENNKPSIAAQLDDTSLDELDEDAKRYREEAGGHRAIGAALAHLRGGASKRIPSPLHSEDASLVSGLELALINAGYEEITATVNYVRPLRRFSRWLFANNKPGIAARLNDESLNEDAAAFDKSPRQIILTALDRVRASLSPGGIAPITVRAGGIEDNVEQPGVPQRFSWPEELVAAGDDQDLLLVAENGPSWSGLIPLEQQQDRVQAGQQEPAGSTSTWSPQMPLDFDWSMWPTSQAAPSLPVQVQSPSTPHELRDDAHYAPLPSKPSDALRSGP
ncbi:hypothetical protein [Bradyrhizobium elkanii]|uniref:hypothetical protein n=1 Tax=Bradyrhizobium elkanii TaxID=29448 RepID=UPI001BAAB1FC|nr:hypothetical protein [Bradyrhizobium elkanii]MBR1164520.1 hypothetical protein [Bradyrhizobium elkanii]